MFSGEREGVPSLLARPHPSAAETEENCREPEATLAKNQGVHTITIPSLTPPDNENKTR